MQFVPLTEKDLLCRSGHLELGFNVSNRENTLRVFSVFKIFCGVKGKQTRNKNSNMKYELLFLHRSGMNEVQGKTT